MGCTSSSTSSGGGGLGAAKSGAGGAKDGHETEARAQCALVVSSWEEVSEKIEKHPFQNYTETVMSTLSTLLYFGGAQCMHIVGKEFFVMVLSSGFGSI